LERPEEIAAKKGMCTQKEHQGIFKRGRGTGLEVHVVLKKKGEFGLWTERKKRIKGRGVSGHYTKETIP